MTHPDTTEMAVRLCATFGHSGDKGKNCLYCGERKEVAPMPDNEPPQAVATDKGPANLFEDQDGDWYWMALREVDSPLFGPHPTKVVAIGAIERLGYTYTQLATPPLNPPEQNEVCQSTSRPVWYVARDMAGFYDLELHQNQECRARVELMEQVADLLEEHDVNTLETLKDILSAWNKRAQ